MNISCHCQYCTLKFEVSELKKSNKTLQAERDELKKSNDYLVKSIGEFAIEVEQLKAREEMIKKLVKEKYHWKHKSFDYGSLSVAADSFLRWLKSSTEDLKKESE